MTQTVLVTAIVPLDSEAIFRAEEDRYRKQCAYELMDELLKLGCIEFETSEGVVLCGCMTDTHEDWCRSKGVKPFAVRAKIRLPDRSELK